MTAQDPINITAPISSTEESELKRTYDDIELEGSKETTAVSERSGHPSKKARTSESRAKQQFKNRNGDIGRGEYFRNRVDRRGRNDAEQEKRRDRDALGKPTISSHAQQFTEEEIAQEDRKPKRKVAVLIGYSGTGYKGMQFNATERTIEGDIFKAFVDAGAISKANADDPKKSQFVRCARTDKGVHAAGNVISLKLIIEDPDVVKKINEKLSPQIRVWGIQRTTSSFSCYALCDSRWYEYLLPTHCLLPPHPRSRMGKKLAEHAREVADYDDYMKRQEDEAGFWEKIDSEKIQPILNNISEDIRSDVEKALFEHERFDEEAEQVTASTDGAAAIADSTSQAVGQAVAEAPTEGKIVEETQNTQEANVEAQKRKQRKIAIEAALKELNNTYKQTKLAYRVKESRLERLQSILSLYCGTNNYHNYTIQKSFKDPSAKRHIKSFQVGKPFEKHGSEWVSLKVHGQSFMMHQIRKMVAMASLVVRSGSDSKIMRDSFGPTRLSIPKAPALGLLLERPVFDTYNEKHAIKFERETIDFAKHEKELEEFKQREIYEKIWLDEEARGEYHAFFRHVDTWKEDEFLFLSSKGLDAVKHKQRLEPKGKSEMSALDSDDEEDAVDS